MSQLDEEAIGWLVEMGQGSVLAFDRFYDRYSGFVYRLALRLSGNRMDAEDICHDVFLEVFRKSEQFDPGRGSVEAWLAIRTKSRTLDLVRRRRRRAGEPLIEAETAAAGSNPAERAVSRLELEMVRSAVSRLPASQKEALYGVFFAGRTQRELAAEMKRPLGTVKSFVRYGLHNLKKQLSQLGFAEAPGGDGRHE